MREVLGVHPDQYCPPSQPNWWNAPAANTQAVVNFVAVAGQRHAVWKLLWAYDDDPTGGQIMVADALGNVLSGPFYITTGGPGFLPVLVNGRMGGALRVILAAGGAGISGSVGVQAYYPHVG